MNQVIQGDCLGVMKTFEDNCIDAIVTDPPYGLSFMGKKWDYDVPSQEIWEECLRVLKPGGYLLAFAGTRTQHRMAVRIEDAGFEIRDMIAWVYGSGFPKSFNMGKAVDKLQGNEREVVGTVRGVRGADGTGHENAMPGKATGVKQVSIDLPLTKGTSAWEGWGTALKPSHEDITLAQKPIEYRSEVEYNISICQKLFASIVKNHSTLNQPDLSVGSDIVQWTAEKSINTLEDLKDAMDILQSYITVNMNLNIVWLWLNILAENLIAMNISTISTKLNTITELKILDSLEWDNILESIIQVKDNQINGLSADVYSVESLLNALKLKLNYILEHSADDNAILSEKLKDLLPSLEPITVARKPIEGTVANNVLKWGVGGINIDGCRVGTDTIKSCGGRNDAVTGDTRTGAALGMNGPHKPLNTLHEGRFPSNLIHDGSDEVVGLFPQTGKSSGGRIGNKGSALNMMGNTYEAGNPGFGDSGSAARFFYCAKASKSERNRGCEDMEEVIHNDGRDESLDSGHMPQNRSNTPKKNFHPTVKPIALMEYLVKLVSPENSIVLDPFAGSGSTLIACKNLGRQYIGIEMNPEYVEIINARLSAVKETQGKLL